MGNAKKAKAPAQASTGSKVYQADDRVGAFPPLGYWDPWGLSTEVTDGQLAYIREAELKHGRICMLASVGIFVAEKWHPLFGGDIDVPALQIVNPANQIDLGFSGLPFWLHQLGSSSSLHLPGTRNSIQETGVILQGTLQSSKQDSKWGTLVTTHLAWAPLPGGQILRGITNSRRRNSHTAVWP